MATEEIKLNEALEEAGLRVVETDLGEWILQLAGQHPSHIVAPAVHLNKDAGARRCFDGRERRRRCRRDREALVAHARVRLREVFAAADIGISGVNLGVAETGTICVVENEGNARLVTALPRIHVAVMGMERVVRRLGRGRPHPPDPPDGGDRRRRRRLRQPHHRPARAPTRRTAPRSSTW